MLLSPEQGAIRRSPGSDKEIADRDSQQERCGKILELYARVSSAPFSPLASGIAVWLIADENRAELYKALRTWLDVNNNWRIEVTLWSRTLRCEVIGGNVQFDVTEMTGPQFLALFNEVRSGD